jgi:hypothetical protein
VTPLEVLSVEVAMSVLAEEVVLRPLWFKKLCRGKACKAWSKFATSLDAVSLSVVLEVLSVEVAMSVLAEEVVLVMLSSELLSKGGGGAWNKLVASLEVLLLVSLEAVVVSLSLSVVVPLSLELLPVGGGGGMGWPVWVELMVPSSDSTP